MNIEELKDQTRFFGLVAIVFICLVVLSTLFFHYIEGWSLLDSYYFTIVTVATVGYGDYTPTTAVGKIGATILIVLGIGLFSTFITMFLKKQALKTAERREARKEKKEIEIEK